LLKKLERDEVISSWAWPSSSQRPSASSSIHRIYTLRFTSGALN
jgi:hypothetical protein